MENLHLEGIAQFIAWVLFYLLGYIVLRWKSKNDVTQQVEQKTHTIANDAAKAVDIKVDQKTAQQDRIIADQAQQIKELQSEINEVRLSNTDFVNSNRDLREERVEFMETIERQRTQIETVSTNAANLEKRVATLEDERVGFQQDKESDRVRITALETDNLRLTEDLRVERSRREQQDIELRDLKARLAANQDVVQPMISDLKQILALLAGAVQAPKPPASEAPAPTEKPAHDDSSVSNVD